MLEAKGSALVAGELMAHDTMTTVRILRGVYDHTGTARRPGTVVPVPSRLAVELIALKKAELVREVPPLPEAVPVKLLKLSGDLTVDPTPPDTEPPKARRQGGRHAEQ